ncbi:hypothetical protein [Actinoplanes sp. NPDC051859]|uniref:hypothetical protein n=1 Tax=Actinoplanes sp. NPDC051859 TaxID=3363909 RepID=UPI003796D763
MKSLVARTSVIVAMTGIALGVAAGPAAAADNEFQLDIKNAKDRIVVSAYGTYDRMMSIPERPVPPVRVSGTLAVNADKCGVVQIAYNAPTDALAWNTVGKLCGKGKTNYTATANLLRGGFQPGLRLCAGTSVKKAEKGANCEYFTPAAG